MSYIRTMRQRNISMEELIDIKNANILYDDDIIDFQIIEDIVKTDNETKEEPKETKKKPGKPKKQ